MEAILHQLIGSLSHDLQGFSTIPGGWEWDFFQPSTVVWEFFFPDMALLLRMIRRQVRRLLR